MAERSNVQCLPKLVKKTNLERVRKKTGEPWKWTKGWYEGLVGLGSSPIFVISLFCSLNQVTSTMLGPLSHNWRLKGYKRWCIRPSFTPKILILNKPGLSLRERQCHRSGAFPSHKPTVASSRSSGADNVTSANYMQAKGSQSHGKKAGFTARQYIS